jgi:hypothetical protein
LVILFQQQRSGFELMSRGEPAELGVSAESRKSGSEVIPGASGRIDECVVLEKTELAAPLAAGLSVIDH